MAGKVTFGAPTALSHRPNPPNRPPEHYGGLVNPAGTLKTVSGGASITWTWIPFVSEWRHPTYETVRFYLDNGTYEVWQGGYLMESGTWTAVA